MRIKIGWLIGLVVIVIISIGATLYVQHSSFAKDKEIMATNFGKKSKVLNEKINSKEKEINSLKEKQTENEDKIKKLEDQINSLKGTTESSSSTETSPETQQENTQVNATSEVPVQEKEETNKNAIASANTSTNQNSVSSPGVEENSDPTQAKNIEIENYFNTKKNEIVDKKKAQVLAWKNDGEVNWSDELINSSLTEFSNSFPPLFGYQSSESLDTIKTRIDKDFQDKYDYQLIK
ncbi:hypothetical protein R6Z02_12885 [Carnobacterium maltaromaticum]|uniref:hypothetical protein n=1 Tax=Carnobacterium maltaromaticum TaxID=2751 RepID=UPI00298B1A53|nr:hypothetical protein [Carnobacterium maltaromaticum]MDW5524647.1 hypothetical protein [Carnobacterium maltaromaticum]